MLVVNDIWSLGWIGGGEVIHHPLSSMLFHFYNKIITVAFYSMGGRDRAKTQPIVWVSMFIHYTNFQIDCIKLYIHCCPFSHRRTLVFNGSIWFLVFFPMHSCHSVSGSMCNECMLVGWLVGQMDEWLVIHSNVPNAALYIWNLFVHQVNIYTRTYYIVANAFAIFVYISKSMITLCRPGPGQQKSTITIIVIIDSQFLLFFG